MVHSLHLILKLILQDSKMKCLFIFLFLLCLTNAAPAPGPAPGAKADPSLLYSTPLIAAPAFSYSNVYRAPPLYSSHIPYIYNLGYASAYSYGAFPYILV